jgi:hypothetical protein
VPGCRSSYLHREWRRPDLLDTRDVWIRRFEAEHFAGLADRSRAPQAPARKSWRLRMVQVYPRQTAHPEAGEFRL